MKDFDLVFGEIDHFGWYQRFHVALLLICDMFMNAFNVFGLVFLTYTPQFWCLDDGNSTNVDEVVRTSNGSANSYDALVNSSQALSQPDECHCPSKRWTYSKRYMESTVVTEWDLVCERSVQVKIMITCLYATNAIGCLTLSMLQDRIGRKPSLSVFITLIVLGNVFAPVIPIFGIYAAFRSVASLTAQNVFSHGYVWSIEFAGPKRRTMVSVLVVTFYGSAVTSVALVAYLFNSWKQLSLIFSLPFIAAYSYNWILSESPRWLLQKGRINEAVGVIERMMRWQDYGRGHQSAKRKLERRQRILDLLELQEDVGVVKVPQSTPLVSQLTALFGTRNLRYLTVIISLCKMISNVTYVGMAFNSENLVENLFIAFAAQAAMQIPAVFLNIVLLDRFGRIITASGSYFLTAGTCFLTALASHFGVKWLVVTLGSMAKFFICLNAAALGQVEAETFPTQFRATGKGLACFCAAIGNMAMPFIIHTSRVYKMMPMFLLGGLTLVGVLLAIQLPETKDMLLPETLEETQTTRVAGFRTAMRNVSRFCGGRIRARSSAESHSGSDSREDEAVCLAGGKQTI